MFGRDIRSVVLRKIEIVESSFVAQEPSDRVKEDGARKDTNPARIPSQCIVAIRFVELIASLQPVTSESGVHDGENGQKGTSNEDRQRRHAAAC